MSKETLIKAVAADLNCSQRDALNVIDTVANRLNDITSSGAVIRLSPLGTFSKRHKKAREGFHPETGEKINIKARDVIVFKASKVR